MNRILVLEGYTNPFGDSHRRSKQQSPTGGNTMKQQSKMKMCAKSWKSGSYRAHMKKCLRKGSSVRRRKSRR
jgi:hypothetical protein